MDALTSPEHMGAVTDAVVVTDNTIKAATSNASTGDMATDMAASADTAVHGDDIVVPDVSEVYEDRKAWIIRQRIFGVQRYAIESKKAGRIPDHSKPDVARALERTRGLLNFLEHDFDISPAMKGATKIDTLLTLVYNNPSFFFPTDLKEQARRLYKQWEAINWGEIATDTSVPDSIDAGSGGEAPSTASSSVDVDNDLPVRALIRRPDPSHPIWGQSGIMFGVAPKIGKIKTMQLDRRYFAEKRPSNRFGDNGLHPGDWYANQLVALFHGAHGARIAGISGTTQDGAYSIVVSGQYKDVDEDHGDRIYYSGPGSQSNTDRNALPEGSTRQLQASLNTGHPVRVLRSAAHNSPFAPSVGIRYDGLYRVIRQMATQRNAHGGQFARFELVRISGQEALDSIIRRSPTAAQMRDHARIWDLW